MFKMFNSELYKQSLNIFFDGHVIQYINLINSLNIL